MSLVDNDSDYNFRSTGRIQLALADKVTEKKNMMTKKYLRIHRSYYSL